MICVCLYRVGFHSKFRTRCSGHTLHRRSWPSLHQTVDLVYRWRICHTWRLSCLARRTTTACTMCRGPSSIGLDILYLSWSVMNTVRVIIEFLQCDKFDLIEREWKCIQRVNKCIYWYIDRCLMPSIKMVGSEQNVSFLFSSNELYIILYYVNILPCAMWGGTACVSMLR